MIESGLLLAGIECPAAAGDMLDVLAPATQRVMARVACGKREDIAQAVAAARHGFAQWSALAPSAREAVLLQAAEIMAAEGEQRYLDLLIDESGSTISKARFEINYAVDLLRTAAAATGSERRCQLVDRGSGAHRPGLPAHGSAQYAARLHGLV